MQKESKYKKIDVYAREDIMLVHTQTLIFGSVT